MWLRLVNARHIVLTKRRGGHVVFDRLASFDATILDAAYPVLSLGSSSLVQLTSVLNLAVGGSEVTHPAPQFTRAQRVELHCVLTSGCRPDAVACLFVSLWAGVTPSHIQLHACLARPMIFVFVFGNIINYRASKTLVLVLTDRSFRPVGVHPSTRAVMQYDLGTPCMCCRTTQSGKLLRNLQESCSCCVQCSSCLGRWRTE